MNGAGGGELNHTSTTVSQPANARSTIGLRSLEDHGRLTATTTGQSTGQDASGYLETEKGLAGRSTTKARGPIRVTNTNEGQAWDDEDRGGAPWSHHDGTRGGYHYVPPPSTAQALETITFFILLFQHRKKPP